MYIKLFIKIIIPIILSLFLVSCSVRVDMLSMPTVPTAPPTVEIDFEAVAQGIAPLEKRNITASFLESLGSDTVTRLVTAFDEGYET